jgi:glycosyltransferase involved in cell wall biosynthesis
VISPSKNAYSETFIQAHKKRLPAEIKTLYGGFFPAFTEDDRPLFPLYPQVSSILRKVFGIDPKGFQNMALRRYFRKEKVEAVLAEYGPTGVSVMEACQTEGIPLIVHFHGQDAYDRQLLKRYGSEYQRLFSAAVAVIAVSHDMEQQLLSLGAPQDKLFYNPYGVDTFLFSGANPASAPPTFIAVGRFVDKKAPHLTLLAFKEVVKICTEARLIMIGDGPLWETCKLLAKALGITESVEFLGPQPQAEVAIAMREARAFVQHSIHTTYGDSEGTPVAVLEAGAIGLPVIATRHGGIVDAVADGETGFLVDEGNIEQMAKYMLKIAQNPETAALLGKQAREYICTKFAIEKSLDQLSIIIETAIKRNKIC